MYGCEEIQSLLKQTRLNSISDIIKFIMEHVSRTINFDPLDDLAIRVTQLERPKGLDRIMIQQVKTLVQAMIEQHQFQFRREVDKQIANAINPLQHRSFPKKTLSDIDVLQMINTVQMNSTINPSRKHYNQEDKKYSLEPILRQITEIRLQLDRKPDKRDLTQLKNGISKELTNKMSMGETQKIVKRFQQQVFQKINANMWEINKIQQNLKNVFNEQLVIVKKDLIDICKNNDIFKVKETKNTLAKLDKKITKYIENSKQENKQNYELRQQFINQVKIQHKTQQKQTIQQINQICQLIQEVENKKQIVGRWLGNGNAKSQCIVWERQLINSNTQIYKFQARKTPIMISNPGFYLISCYVFGSNKSPTILLNSELISKLDAKGNNNQYTANYRIHQVINVMQNRSLLTIKMDGDDSYSWAIIMLEKI